MGHFNSMKATHSPIYLRANTVITYCFPFTHFLSSKTPQLGHHHRLFKYLNFEITEYFESAVKFYANFNWYQI